MLKTATLTSKRQLTLPKEVFVRMTSIPSRKFSIEFEEGKLILTPIDYLIDQLAGSLTAPSKWKNKSTEEIIAQSKKEYFSNKNK